MGIRETIDAAVALAKAGTAVFPSLSNGVALAEKTLDILDDLKSQAPTAQSEDMAEQAHKELYSAMVAKGHALSARLRG